MNIARKTLLAIAIGAALIVVARLLIGPFHLLALVRSPLNAEGICDLAITVLLLTAPHAAPPPENLGYRTAMLVLGGGILLIVIAFSRLLGTYFVSDDFITIKYALNATPPYFASLFKTPGGDGFFRPVGTMAFTPQAYWAGDDSFRWHALGIVLHVVNSVLVYLLAARLFSSRFAALFGAALFGFHNIHAEAVVWTTARFDLISTLLVLTGLLLFLRSCDENGSCRLLYGAGALVTMTLAILTKESAYIFPILLLICLHAGRKREYRLVTLAPFFIVSAGIFAYRWSLFHGIGGYLVGGRPQALQLGFATTLKAIGLRLWAVLYFPINWSTEPGWLLGLVTAAGVSGALMLAASHRTVELWPPVAFVLVAVIPPLHLLLGPGGPDLKSSRILYLPSVGFCLLLAGAVAGLRGWRRTAVPSVLLLYNLAFLEQNLGNWEYVSARVKAACDVGADYARHASQLTVEGLPATIRGVPAFASFEECVEMKQKLSTPVQVQQVPAAAIGLAGDGAVLTWDERTEELRCSRRCFPGNATP